VCLGCMRALSVFASRLVCVCVLAMHVDWLGSRLAQWKLKK
jgi:hypothetical protein